jgi:FKBP-type peptidyl-prolyl cis-trans isomerase FkpA
MRGIVVLTVVAVAAAACNRAAEDNARATGERGAAVEQHDEPDQVARTYAAELGVDVNRMQEGPDGLRYEDVVEGTGAVAEAGRSVVVHYTGWLPDGTLFDSSHDHGQPFQVEIGRGHVIRGWDEGIPGMREGGTRRLVIPHGMAYGAGGMGPIPPRSTLVFDVELLQVR